MRRPNYGFIWKCVSNTVWVVFLIFGCYGIYNFFKVEGPKHRIEFYDGNKTVDEFPYPDHGSRLVSQYMQIGEILPNCGLDRVCPPNHFPVHVYSGKNNLDMPKICVAGKYVIQKDINNGGRGINMVVVDTLRLKAVNARRFDTYAMDSSEMELFLLREVKDGDIVIAVTFDEASRNLGHVARTMLADLGSNQIQNLQFRGQWYMISQRGINGFTPYEELKPSKGGVWANIDLSFCVSREIEGHKIIADPVIYDNQIRANFCSRHNIGDFCSVDERHAPLKPAMLTNRQLVGSAIFTTPIMVLGGTSLAGLAHTLETILSQPGLHPAQVSVIHNPEQIQDVPELCKLFGFAHVSTAEVEYYKLMELAFETAHALHPGSLYVTILEEGLLLAPDFLTYTAMLLPLLNDPTVLAISAWNPNGFTVTSSRPDLVYRIEGFPGLGFTMKKDIYFKELKKNMKTCCSKRGWEGWMEIGRWEREIAIPDVSRVLRRPVGPELEPETPLIRAFFKRLRATNLEMTAQIKNADQLLSDRYEDHLVELLNSTNTTVLRFSADVIRKCAENQDVGTLGITLGNKESNAVTVLAYKEGNMQEFLGMKRLAKCFGLFYEENILPQGLHRGMIRFSVKGEQVILLSNMSPHFRLQPYSKTYLVLP
ncbi:protein O-linked-mannose beta-1,2-N-acetylglucosaminyltransferase 1-like isoform X2 [Oratosquilla oratoria]|uniref:protein O-linked-mannose beta-1,2-N-acetylglucosaminyltransferase 1-like isoform X2 n=1 Tax=Oratosquilla oratoria TaxID=337810 RepID=UPI003F777BD4